MSFIASAHELHVDFGSASLFTCGIHNSSAKLVNTQVTFEGQFLESKLTVLCCLKTDPFWLEVQKLLDS